MKKNSSAFVNQLVVCALVTITVGGSTGLGTVWMRHQNSMTARNNQALAAELVRIERLIDEKKTQIETEQAPDRLRALNNAMSLGLVRIDEVPVEFVTENTVDRLARRSGQGFIDTDRAVAPAPITFRIAAAR